MADESYTVYCHTNRINGKMYFGVTKHTIEERAGKNGRDYVQCTYFNNAIKKYGWDNFTHEVVKDGLSKEEASEYEHLLVTFFDTNNREKGYNIQPGGLHAGGMSPEGFERFRQACIAANKKPVVSFTKDGKRLMEFDSISSAAEYYGVSDSGIEHSLYTENGTCHGMLFRWASDVSSFVDMPEDYLNEHVRVRHYKNGKSWKCTDVVLFDENGKRLMEFGSAKECAKYLGVFHGTVSAVVNGRTPTVKGCYVRKKSDVGDAEAIDISGIYKTKNMAVAWVDEAGNVIESYVSLTKAAKSVLGDSKCVKRAAITGRPYHGRLWKML